MLLKLVLIKVNVLVLDEPTRNLSPLSTPVIYRILSEFNVAIIGVSHDKSFIENVFDDMYILKKSGLFTE